MKVLNIKSDGTFSFIASYGEGNADTSNESLSAADAQLFQDEIDTLQAQGLQELHLEKGPMRTFVHKVGHDKFIVEDDPDAYNCFVAMDQWGPSVFSSLQQ